MSGAGIGESPNEHVDPDKSVEASYIDRQQAVDAICKHIKANRVSRRTAVLEHTRIYGDLGIYGDDAWEILEWLISEFDVDMTRFHFDRYFRSEGTRIISTLMNFTKRRSDYENFLPLTVGDLAEAIVRRRWNADGPLPISAGEAAPGGRRQADLTRPPCP